jgi:hypothetical protein
LRPLFATKARRNAAIMGGKFESQSNNYDKRTVNRPLSIHARQGHRDRLRKFEQPSTHRPWGRWEGRGARLSGRAAARPSDKEETWDDASDLGVCPKLIPMESKHDEAGDQ